MQTMKKLFLILSVAAGLVSCEDFLTAGDPNKIDAPSYFRNESDLEAYANGFLQTMIPTAISVATGDARADYNDFSVAHCAASSIFLMCSR